MNINKKITHANPYTLLGNPTKITLESQVLSDKIRHGSTYLSIYLSAYLSIYLDKNLSIYLSTYLPRQEPMTRNCNLKGLHPFSTGKTIAIIRWYFINLVIDTSFHKLLPNTFSSFLRESNVKKKEQKQRINNTIQLEGL